MTEPYQTPVPVESKEVGAPKTNWKRRGLIVAALVVVLGTVALAMPAGVVSHFLGFDKMRGGPPQRMIDFDDNRGPAPEPVIQQPVSQDVSAVPVP